MTEGVWQRVYELFHEALPLSAEERQALLQSRCGEEPDLRAEVERLLARDAQAEREDFLAPPHETTRDGVVLEPLRSLKLHCPNCGAGIELVDQAPADHLECPTCHSRIALGSSVRLPRTVSLGTNRISSYELVEPVGTGAFGTVYRAYDSKLQRDVAVKLLRRLAG